MMIADMMLINGFFQNIPSDAVLGQEVLDSDINAKGKKEFTSRSSHR